MEFNRILKIELIIAFWIIVLYPQKGEAYTGRIIIIIAAFIGLIWLNGMKIGFFIKRRFNDDDEDNYEEDDDDYDDYYDDDRKNRRRGLINTLGMLILPIWGGYRLLITRIGEDSEWLIILIVALVGLIWLFGVSIGFYASLFPERRDIYDDKTPSIVGTWRSLRTNYVGTAYEYTEYSEMTFKKDRTSTYYSKRQYTNGEITMGYDHGRYEVSNDSIMLLWDDDDADLSVDFKFKIEGILMTKDDEEIWIRK